MWHLIGDLVTITNSQEHKADKNNSDLSESQVLVTRSASYRLRLSTYRYELPMIIKLESS